MNSALVMTVIGPDRPGLVETIAAVVAEQGGNWLESRMSRLGGQFAGLLRIEVPSEKESVLAQTLKNLESTGLNIVVQPDRSKPAPPGPRLHQLAVVGHDRPGIVRQISHALASHGVNVEELHTETESAAMAGDILFKAQALVSIPATCNLKDLQAELEKIAEDLIVDVSLAEYAEPR